MCCYKRTKHNRRQKRSSTTRSTLRVAIPTQDFAPFVVIFLMGKIDYRSQLCTRWIALVLICFFMACVYYSFDNPAALHDQLRDHFSHLSTREYEYNFNLLYTAYSTPNVILPFLGAFSSTGMVLKSVALCFCASPSLGKLWWRMAYLASLLLS